MDVQNYFKDHKYRTELHAHTNPVSACGKFSPEDVVATYKQFGVNADDGSRLLGNGRNVRVLRVVGRLGGFVSLGRRLGRALRYRGIMGGGFLFGFLWSTLAAGYFFF